MSKKKGVNGEEEMRSVEENYFCHIIIPSKNDQKPKFFFEKVFGWKVEKRPKTSSWDILPPSRKGPSA